MVKSGGGDMDASYDFGASNSGALGTPSWGSRENTVFEAKIVTENPFRASSHCELRQDWLLAIFWNYFFLKINNFDLTHMCNPSTAFHMDVYRSGFYGGKGGRQMASFGPFKGSIQDDPPVGNRRLRECQWDACKTFTIPENWTSGIYLCKLTALESGLQSYIL